VLISIVRVNIFNRPISDEPTNYNRAHADFVLVVLHIIEWSKIYEKLHEVGMSFNASVSSKNKIKYRIKTQLTSNFN